jgi:CBS-domain-containing membrane protein
MSRVQTNTPHIIARWLGIELDVVSGREKLVSMLGGFVSVALLLALSQNLLPDGGASLFLASMGASAVLLFAVPHGQLSQPWPVLAGHVFSAFIGVTCARFIPSVPIAVGCAVGLTILMMHQLKCIHPPGGATALTAVIGGAPITNLGYSFVWSPVLLNALSMVVVAIAFNFLFSWRRYPAAWNRGVAQMEAPREAEVTHESVVAALRSLDSFVDISEDDLMHLHRILSQQEKVAATIKR